MGISILAWLSSRDPHIGPRRIIYGSRDDNHANMEIAHVLNYLLYGLDMEMIL